MSLFKCPQCGTKICNSKGSPTSCDCGYNWIAGEEDDEV